MVLKSTHNLCFGTKIRKKVYPCILQFYYINVGFEGVFIARTCFPHVRNEPKCFKNINGLNRFHKSYPILRANVSVDPNCEKERYDMQHQLGNSHAFVEALVFFVRTFIQVSANARRSGTDGSDETIYK